MKKIVHRKIFPEDYAALRKLVYIKNKTFIEVFEELYIIAKLKIELNGVDYYYKYNAHTSNYLLHKSITLPIDFNDFLISFSSRGFPAKHLLSAIIQDYMIHNN